MQLRRRPRRCTAALIKSGQREHSETDPCGPGRREGAPGAGRMQCMSSEKSCRTARTPVLLGSPANRNPQASISFVVAPDDGRRSAHRRGMG